MKIYFAKYLPYEGNIKEGEDYWCSVYGYRKGNHASRNVPKGEERFKPVKLFLCSRDIQVGDKVYATADDFYRTYDGYSDLCTDEIKIIGEISPQAIWVKEGDEFEEDEIKRNIIAKEFGIEEYPIKIKCSQCNNFH